MVNTAGFLAVRALLLGPCAFYVWDLLESRGSHWPDILSMDFLAAAGIGTVLTALFLAIVAVPIQLCLSASAPLLLRLVWGVLSGPLGVWLGLLLASRRRYPIEWDWYVSRAWTLHVVFCGMGLAFAWMWWRRQRNGGVPASHPGQA